MYKSIALTFRRIVRCIVWASMFVPVVASAQFSIALPLPSPSDEVLREDMQMQFLKRQLEREGYQRRVAHIRATLKTSKSDTLALRALRREAQQFCAREWKTLEAQCSIALLPDSLAKRYGVDGGDPERPLGVTYVRSLVPGLYTSRGDVVDYLRHSGGQDAFAFASQFTANVGENEAYVVTSVVRGLLGRGIFSADQAAVVTRSPEADSAKRSVVENDRANLLRAVNNGGTLVARYTIPMYVRAGATATTALGISTSIGVLGPITGSDERRTGAGSASFEMLTGFPVRSPDGTANVLADLIIGARAGYTYAGAPILADSRMRDVAYTQLMIGLRQNGNMSVSALVTIANKDVNRMVPKLTVNFAARR